MATQKLLKLDVAKTANHYDLINIDSNVKCSYTITDVLNKKGKIIIEIDVKGGMSETDTEQFGNSNEGYLFLTPNTNNTLNFSLTEKIIYPHDTDFRNTQLQLTFTGPIKIGSTTAGDVKIGNTTDVTIF